MTNAMTAHDIKAARDKTGNAQSDAADPLSSAWVSANAGTGKTHVLTNRVLRLLLAGTRPERILCLTYTKAAAAEMSKRVFDRLAAWVTESDKELAALLTGLTSVIPDEKAIAHARTLFTSAIESPGGLKVQTIHAFAERLLQRFPLEAGVPPGFKILDDEKGRELTQRAINDTLEEATGDPDASLGQALKTAIRYATDSNFDELLTKTIAERNWLAAASRLGEGVRHDDFTAAEKFLRKTLGVGAKASEASLATAGANVLSDAELASLRDHLAGGSKTDIKNSRFLGDALAQMSATARAACLAGYFLTGKDEPRASLMTKKLADERADLLAIAERAQSAFRKYNDERKALAAVEATTALYRLADAVLQRYQDAKAASGALDFDDLIVKTGDLLKTSDSAEWVLFKLDGGLDHILVDEAQDTSPVQWEIIESLAREFFSGASARDTVRTVFAVGDEKQSIYSFQGAEPEKFDFMGKRFAQFAVQVQGGWRHVPLNLSFRTVQPILDAVDSVFADPQRTPGLTASAQNIRHIASRFGQAGLIEVWPLETYGETEPADPWKPLEDSSERAPASRVAERIAATIDDWISQGEMLPSLERPIRAGDVLILVRKRHPFAIPMVAALKARGIAVAGSDRIQLIEQVAVQDLLTLGDFLTLPEDDLALATVLKSPLFNLTDDDLLGVAPARKGALWKAFLAEADTAPRLRVAAETLKRWRAKADFTPPYEFFAALLDRDGGRAQMLNRLGPESADAIDEFLDAALNYDDGSPPSLTGFLAAMRQGRREIKRDMEHGRNEVRVMTVHGAKGLEAPIVFLADTCTTASGESPGARLVKLNHAARPPGTPKPILWAVKGTSRIEAVQQAISDNEKRDREERNRLLYVAMTRARDRLYIAGFEGRKGRSAGCWYDCIVESLETKMAPFAYPDGVEVKRLEGSQSEPAEKEKSAPAGLHAAQPLPDFAKQRAPAEPQLTVPLSPSRLEPYAPDAEGEPIITRAAAPGETRDRPSPTLLAAGNRFLRGTLTHALLEHLPSLPENLRAEAAEAFVEKRGIGLTKKARTSIVNETLAILTRPEFKELFSVTSRAEVPIAATLPRPSGKGPALKLSGQIDRLAVTEREVFVVDYKTNRPPPLNAENVAPAYLYQLAAYVLALGEIYPGKRVKAALLWTDGPRLMEIPEATLKEYVGRLWDLDTATLDAT